MADSNQNHAAVVDGSLLSLRVTTVDTSISWSRHMVGNCTVRVLSHAVAKWVSLGITETPIPGRGRYTMATLHEPAARALYEQLKAVFEEPKP